jgi:hypothetical protein
MHMKKGDRIMAKAPKRSGRCLSRRNFLVIGGLAVGTVLVGSGVKKLLTSEEEIHRDEVIEFQKLSRPKIAELLGGENYDRCCAAMLREYDEFAPRLPVLEGENNKRQFYHSAPFMLSLYRALFGEFAFSRDEALDLLSQITNYKVRKDFENRTIEKFFLSRLAESEFIRELGMRKLEYQDEEYGWAVEFPESNAYMAFDMTRCGLADWFSAQGVPEIAPIACEGDFVAAEFYTGLELVRTKTIAGGDQICDFRYVKERA